MNKLHDIIEAVTDTDIDILTDDAFNLTNNKNQLRLIRNSVIFYVKAINHKDWLYRVNWQGHGQLLKEAHHIVETVVNNS